MSPIITLQRQLVEVGRLRMGKKGDRGQPQKLDTWRLTSRDKARLEAVAEQHGGTVQPWAEREGEYEVITTTDELPIMLLPGQVLSSWYEVWSAGGCQRRCDGGREILTDSPCLCDQETGDRKCKPTTRLSVMLPDIPGLGCWRLESHGWYAASELAATSHMLEQATARGQLLPARLRIDQRRQVKDGKTTRYAVPVIDIDITMREALPLAMQQPVLESGHTPVQRALTPGVTLDEGLAATAAQSGEPRVTNGRSAAPIPSGDEIGFGDEPVPVPSEAAPPSPAPEGTPDKRSPAQAKKLNVLVGKLRPDHLSTLQLWQSMGREPVASEDGILHWSPLRDSLSKAEASELIDRLDRYAADKLESEGNYFENRAAAVRAKGAA